MSIRTRHAIRGWFIVLIVDGQGREGVLHRNAVRDGGDGLDATVVAADVNDGIVVAEDGRVGLVEEQGLHVGTDAAVVARGW